ncbi:MAG: phage major tail protein, TP901-1 family [Thermohalobaculum sp.]|nr:phage major tail protein, TP901-1 family [Thermohalobaculum sp.]
MAAQKGKDLLIKLDEAGTGVFVTVAGLRATRLSFNQDTVDVTTADAPGQWRELLAGAGLRTAAVSGSGIFRDAASDAALRRVFFEGRAPAFELAIPDFGTVSGPFQITNLEYAGNHDGEATFEISLASAGELGFAEL